jgi:pyridoxal phosphate enzyme (YggS family)
MSPANDIAANLASVRSRIAQAAQAAGRDPADITLVAVSKTYGSDAVGAALAAGADIFGENRVQEAAQKFPLPGARLHIIGSLQTNKAKDAVRLADCIDSLDRDSLSVAIERAAQTQGRCPDLLVQVNIGDEPQKSGIPTEGAHTFIRATAAKFGTKLRGLMCIPPAGQDPLPYFQKLNSLADAHDLPIRSMGMSGDFEAAIAAGATHIRIGSAIFGSRPALPAT